MLEPAAWTRCSTERSRSSSSPRRSAPIPSGWRASTARRSCSESWLGCEIPRGGPLIGALQRQFCHALYRQLAGKDAAAVVLEQTGRFAVPANALKPGGGALVIELDVDGIPLTMLAPVGLWPDLAAWQVPRPGPALQQVASALDETVVQVEVRLPGVLCP